MLHILHVIESLEFGGAEKVLLHLANKSSGIYKVSICLTKRQGELLEEVDPDIDVYFLDTGEGNGLRLPLKLKELILEKQVDIVQCHNWGVYLESTLAIILARRAKLIHTVHGHYTIFESGIKSVLKIKIRHILEFLASYITYKFVPVSKSIQDYIISEVHVPLNKIQIIHNGITGLKNVPHVKKNPLKGIKFITVGRLAKIKNHAMLLKAFKIALDNDNSIKLSIVGDGPEMKNLVNLSNELNIEKSVDFLGFKTNINELLIEHDVFLMSSEYEGISIAILEAMSINMPVIATNVGGNPEVVINNKTGLIVPEDNVNKFSTAIMKYINNDSLIRQHGFNGKQFFYDNFHEPVVLKQYFDLYNNSQA